MDPTPTTTATGDPRESLQGPSFLKLSPALIDAANTGLVVTANERLRRELQFSLNQHYHQQGLQVWPTPALASLDSVVQRWFHALWRLHPSAHPTLISDADFELLCRSALQAVSTHSNPTNLPSLLRWAMDAWRTTSRWYPGSAEPDFTALGRAQPLTQVNDLGLRWLHEIQRRLRSLDQISAAELPRYMARQSLAPVLEQAHQSLSLLGFEQLENAVAVLLQQIETVRPVRILAEADDSMPDSTPTLAPTLAPTLTPTLKRGRVTCPDGATEFALVARWCRHLLDTDANVRIGIVHPNLMEVRGQLERALGAELSPLASSASTIAFNVGAGRPLSGEPIWLAAAEFLQWCLEPATATQAHACLNSPFLTRLPSLQLSDKLRRTFSPAQLAAHSVDKDTGEQQPRLTELAQNIERLPARASFAQWLTNFSDLLELVGWTGGGAGSGQFQAYEQIVETTTADSLDTSLWSAQEALDAWQSQLSNRVFAPQSARAPVTVLGALETTGLQFSHLWVMGMRDVSWPGPVTLNPLLPIPLLHAWQVPRSDSQGELLFASQRLRTWEQATNNLVLSHPSRDGESEYDPSPLITHLPELNALQVGLQTPVTDSVPDLADTRHPLVRASAKDSALLEQVPVQPTTIHRPAELAADATNPAPTPAAQRGGMTVLKDQAECPFRAFAIHHLGLARIPEPHSYPHAGERGTLVHALLEIFGQRHYQRLPDSPLTEAELQRFVNFEVETRFSRFPAEYRNLESARMVRLLQQFQQFESVRLNEPLTIIGCEINSELVLGRQLLKLRIDRVDHSGGKTVVIDYKTGEISTSGLLKDRLLEPQLAAYACVIDDTDAVALYQINATEVKAKAIADAPVPGMKTEVPKVGDFAALKQRWRVALTQLDSEFTEGYAAVTPNSTNSCRYCHLQALCRINVQQDSSS